MPACVAKKRDGTPCNNHPMTGLKMCYAHIGSAKLSHRVLNFLTNNKKLGAVLGFLLTVGIFSYEQYQHWDEARHTAMTGTITGTQRGDWQLVILSGGAPFAFKTSDGVILRDGERSLLSAQRNFAGNVVFSLPIRDKEGKLIADIQNNEWTVQPATAFDRNYTDHLLEVKDAYGAVVMQVVDLGEYFYVAGRFRCHDGRNFFAFPNPDGSGGGVFKLPSNEDEPNFSLKPICKYPSNHHLGECSDLPKPPYEPHDPNAKALFISEGLEIGRASCRERVWCLV